MILMKIENPKQEIEIKKEDYHPDWQIPIEAIRENPQEALYEAARRAHEVLGLSGEIRF